MYPTQIQREMASKIGSGCLHVCILVVKCLDWKHFTEYVMIAANADLCN